MGWLLGAAALIALGVIGRWLWKLRRFSRAIASKLGTRARREGWRLGLFGEHDGVSFELSLSPWWVTRSELHCVIWVGEHDSIRLPGGDQIISATLAPLGERSASHESVVPLASAPELSLRHSKYDEPAEVVGLCDRPEVVAAAKALLATGVKSAEVFGGRVFVGFLDEKQLADPIVERILLSIEFWRALTLRDGPYR